MNISLRRIGIALGVVACVAIVGCQKAPPPPAPYKHVTDMKEFMNVVLDPIADRLWASVGIIVTDKGEEKIEPKTDAEWAAVVTDAAAIGELANTLMMDDRAVDREGWMLAARLLVDQSERALKAAQAKDPETLFTANSDLYLACNGCHGKYIFGGAGEAASAK